MVLDATARRRWFGVLVLAAALALLAGGETVLKGRLSALAFLLYWLLCLALTGLAIIVAFLDFRALQQRSSREQRDLFQETLKEIETDAKTKARRPQKTEIKNPKSEVHHKSEM